MSRIARIHLVCLTFAALAAAGCHSSNGNPPAQPQNSTVGGNAFGLTGNVVLQLNGANNLTVSGAGGFTFGNSLASGTAYAVSVLSDPATQSCSVTNASGTVSAGANVTNVTLTCSNLPIVSGTAAVGAALTGTVTVKDAAGATKTVTIGANGGYTLDLAGMTGPFVLRAQGTANGMSYVVHSAATSADFAGTINITPLTDLLVSNVAGQLASASFDAGNFGTLTAAALDAEVTQLRTRLLPVLEALGVSATVDLLRTPFTPAQPGIDTVLEMLRVTFDAAGAVATITNIVTQQQITDDVAMPASGEAGAPVLTSTTGLSTADADMDAAKAALTAFAAKFATALPTQASLEALMTADFLHDDKDRAVLAAELAAAAALTAGSFGDVVINRIDYSPQNVVTVYLDFSAKDRNGIEIFRWYGFGVRKETDGVWRLYGNRRVMEAEGSVFALRDTATGCVATGVEIIVADRNPVNTGGTVNHFNVIGPGLPSAGVRFNSTGGAFVAATGASPDSTRYTIGDTCGTPVADAVIAALPDNPTYLIVPYTSSDDSVRLNFPSGAIVAPASPTANGAYWLTFEKRPLTLTEASASTAFPTITAPTATALTSYNGGALTVAGGNASTRFYAKLELDYRSTNGARTDVEETTAPQTNGSISEELTLPTAAANTILKRSLIVSTFDSSRRSLMSRVSDPQFTVSGAITGLSGSVTLRLNGGNDVVVGGSGPFTFPAATLPNGAAYTVAIAGLPPTQTCAVTAGGGTIAGADVTNVAITCKDYSLGGTIAGLSAPGLVLTVNNGNDLTVPAGGSFTFPSSMSLRAPNQGSAFYLVHIKAQPVGQTCTIVRPFGVVPFAAPNIRTPQIACVTNTTDVLSGTYRAIAAHSDGTADADLSIGAGFVSFNPDGTYIFALRQDQPDCGANNGNGLEYGAYSYNQATGDLRVTASLDTNGECGIADTDDLGLNTFTPAGERIFTKNPDGTLMSVFDDGKPDGPFYITWAPVTSTAGTLIGSFGDNQFFDVFSPDGTLFSAVTFGVDGVGPGAASTPGIEQGCYSATATTASSGSYTANFTGTCTIGGASPPVDTTGQFSGYSLWGPAVLPFAVSGNTLIHTGRPFPVTRLGAETYSVGGTITGLTGAGLTLTLNGQRDPAFVAKTVVNPITGALDFKFPAGLPAGATYAVLAVAQPTGPTQICGANNGLGTMGSADVTNIQFTCGPSAPYAVSGTITGLTGAGLMLRMTAASYLSFSPTVTDLPILAGIGSFAFPPDQVPAGGSFMLGIVTQPIGQACTITKGRAIISPANITNVEIACINLAPSALTGTYVSADDSGDRFLGVVHINADGTYTTALRHDDPTCNLPGETRNGNGVEQGVLTWNPVNGQMVLPVKAVVDTNGECGFSDPGEAYPRTSTFVTKNGANLEFRDFPGGPLLATGVPAESVPGTIVGAFVPEAKNGRLLVFRADGTFLFADVQGAGLFPSGYGQERGCYTYSPANHAVTLSIGSGCRPDGQAAYDLNGFGDLFLPGLYSLTFPLTIDDANTITFAGVVYKRTAPTLSLSGSVSGLSGSVVLRVNGGHNVTVEASGPFSFDGVLSNGAAYAVSVVSQPTTQICAVTAGGTGTANGNVTGVAVQCKNYSLGGTIGGPAPVADGLVLTVNGFDLPVPPASPTFLFGASTSLRLPIVPAAVFYDVRVKAQPDGQTCTLANADGGVLFATPDVSTVAVTCVTNDTDALSGTYKTTTRAGDPVLDRVFLTFYPDGTYIAGIHGIPSGLCAPGQPEDLIQYGAYNYDATSGALSIDRALHYPANGCGGFDDDDIRGTFTLLGTVAESQDGTLTIDAAGGDLTLAPVISTPGTLIGSWGDNAGFDVFEPGGTLFSVTTQGFYPLPSAGLVPGLEDGCYLLSGTTSAGSFELSFDGTCAVSGLQTGVDTNGVFGYSAEARLGVPEVFEVSSDTLLLRNTAPLTRIITN